MRAGFIRLGDPTTSGGEVVSASGGPFMLIDGKPAALEGDLATCPLHKGTFKIVGGYDGWIDNNRRAAVEDFSRLECGCSVISTVRSTFAAVDSSPPAQGGGNGGSAWHGRESTSAAFDEALQFISGSGNAIAQTRYTLELSNGRTFSGITDDEGNTARVVTGEPVSIVRATLLPPERMNLCCARPGPVKARDVYIDAVRTNADRIGYSKATVTVEGKARNLTVGELAIARSVFGSAITYSKVKVHNEEYLWFGLQPDNTAMTPDGEIYFSPSRFKEDFSNGDAFDKSWFIHEMAHVWQFQLGYPTASEGALLHPTSGFGVLDDSYSYVLVNPDRSTPRLSDFNMEQQADIIADYFLIEAGLVSSTNKSALSKSGKQVDDWSRFYRVLLDFVTNPRDKTLLPGGRR